MGGFIKSAMLSALQIAWGLTGLSMHYRLLWRESFRYGLAAGQGGFVVPSSPRWQRWQAPETSPRTAGWASCMGLSGGPTSGGWRSDFPSNGWLKAVRVSGMWPHPFLASWLTLTAI